MILIGENFEKVYNSDDVKSHLKKYGCYFLDLVKVADDKILVYDKEELVDEIKTRNEELEGLFARRSVFKLSLTSEGYYVIRYCDIHKHSLYSILDGMSTIAEIVKHTEYAGALTDHGNMYGFFKFYNAMNKVGKKPIIGFEAYVKGYYSDKKDKGRNHLVILVKNSAGFKNAIKLSTLGYIQGQKTKQTVRPRFEYEELFKHKEGLIVTSACLGGDIQKNIRNNEIEKAYEIAKRFKEEFGEDFYIEIQRHGIDIEKDVNRHLIQIAKDLDIKVIAGVDSHYAKKEDRTSQERLLALNTGTTMSNPNRYSFDGDGYHIHTSDEMVKLFHDIPEALDNTLEILDKIDFKMETGTYYLPEFDIPEEHRLYINPQNETEVKANEYNYFEFLCKKGLEERGLKGDKEAEERLDFEMGVIKKMGYASYFLIVWDFINFAKSNGILVGPGRGSACGSIASYCLMITDVNPLEYGLLFERFLSPDRISMPDK